MANCAFPKCTVTRKERYKDVSIFKLPTRKAEFYSTWRKNMLDVLSKYRVMDSSFKKKVMECEVNLFICERHFAPGDIEFTKNAGKKTLKLQALPTINLPVKSHETTPVVERRHLNIVREIVVNTEKYVCYKTFSELVKRLGNIKLQDWSVVTTDAKVYCKYYVQPYMIPYLYVIIDERLEFTIIVFAWLLPFTHEIYKRYSRSMENITVSELLKEILSFKLCPGLPIRSSTLMSHVIPCDLNLQEEHDLPYKAKEYYRHKECLVLNGDDEPCLKCTKSKKHNVNVRPCHPNAPLSLTNPERIIETLKMERKENKELKKMLEREMNKKGINVDDNPTLHQCGYDSNTIRMAMNVAPVTGNTKGKQQKRRVSWSIVDHTPLPKRVSGKGVKQ